MSSCSYMYTSSLLLDTALVVPEAPQSCSRDPADDDNRHNQLDFLESVNGGGAEGEGVVVIDRSGVLCC